MYAGDVWRAGKSAALRENCMITALATLLVSQLAGEALVRLASLPIPGPVVCMILFFVVMLTRTPLPPALGETERTHFRYTQVTRKGIDPSFANGANYPSPRICWSTLVCSHVRRRPLSAIVTSADQNSEFLSCSGTYAPAPSSFFYVQCSSFLWE